MNKMEEKIQISDIKPMLNKIAECFDDYLEENPKDIGNDFLEAVELMNNIVIDNDMFIRD